MIPRSLPRPGNATAVTSITGIIAVVVAGPACGTSGSAIPSRAGSDAAVDAAPNGAALDGGDDGPLDAAADAPTDAATVPVRMALAPPPGGAYLGTWANPALGSQVAAIASLETVLGHQLAVHTSYWGFNGGHELSSIGSDAASLDDRSKGRYPLISWGCSSDQGTTFQAIADGTYDTNTVIPAAEALKSFGAPVFLRPSWEFNLNVGNPKGNPNGNNCYSAGNTASMANQEAEYIAYFRHLVSVFEAQGVTNVTWVWNPAVSAVDFQNVPIDDFYPGASAVDWIAGDTYDKTAQPTRGFVGIWSAFWSHYSGFGKPLMIGETGEYNNATDAYTQQRFFDDATTALQPGGTFFQSPTVRIAALVYFDSFPSSFNWTVESPSDANGKSAWSTMATLPFFGTK